MAGTISGERLMSGSVASVSIGMSRCLAPDGTAAAEMALNHLTLELEKTP